MARPRFRCKYFEAPHSVGATIFLLTAFKSRHWFYKSIVNELLHHGFDVYVYDYPTRPLLDAQPEQWVEFTQNLTSDIQHNIRVARQRNPRVRFGTVGASVGSTLALHAAKRCPELEKMVFVTLYGSSAQLVWENKTLKKIKKKFVKSNRTMQDAFKAFGPLEATTELERLGKRPILLFASMDDKVISFRNTNLFIRAAIEHQLNFTYKIVGSVRHSLTVARVLSDYPAWLPFLYDLRSSTPVEKPRPTAKNRVDKAGNRGKTAKRVSYV